MPCSYTVVRQRGLDFMDTEKLLSRMAGFDPSLYAIVDREIERQLDTLSLVPTANAASPFISYLRGSALGNSFMDNHSMEMPSELESMATARAAALYGADHAIVRLGSIGVASRVVFFALAKSGDTIMSFNLRKSEFCTGEHMQYNFVNFCRNPQTKELDYDAIEAKAKECKPKILIMSPVNYTHKVDYARLSDIAHAVGAKLWADLGQNAGLIAAKQLPSPMPFADVVTFPADVLHGPQNGIILCHSDLAKTLDNALITSGHASVKMNVLAALAMVFHEADTPEFRQYSEQVIANARALEKGLTESGIDIITPNTQNHLVLPVLPEGTNGEDLKRRLENANILVKPEEIKTEDPAIHYNVLRLSSIDPTTRSLKEEDMEDIGRLLGAFLKSKQNEAAIMETRDKVMRIIGDIPLFSEEWLPESELSESGDNELLEMMARWTV